MRGKNLKIEERNLFPLKDVPEPRSYSPDQLWPDASGTETPGSKKYLLEQSSFAVLKRMNHRFST